MALDWERIQSHEPGPPRGVPAFEPMLLRTRVPGGWLVVIEHVGMTFVPDPQHGWESETIARKR